MTLRFLLRSGALALTATGALANPTLVIQPTDGDGLTVADPQRLELDDATSAVASLEKGDYQFSFDDGSECAFPLGAEADQRVRFNNPLPIVPCSEQPFQLKVRVAGDILFSYSADDKTVSLTLQPKKTASAPYVRPLPDISCPKWQGEMLTVDVGNVFKDGEWVRDFYSGQTAQVIFGKVVMTPAPGSNGMLLLESAEHQPAQFSWDNLTVYFVMPDRFHNGDPSNDHSFGRQKDGKDEIGTFHGGDLKGLIEKLDYIAELGANAIWMTPIVEQVRGFVGGGKNGDFPFYSYHGYWALDYTRLDPNFGTDEDLRVLVREAHKRGIRLIWDAVINHAGYATGQDLVDFNVEVFKGEQVVDNQWRPGADQNWHSYHEYIDYQSENWNRQWWGGQWVRGTFPGYVDGAGDDLTKPLAGLPDYITESETPVPLPPLLANKADTRAEGIERTVAEHVIDWQADWVREFGIDAFRADTVKHVELERWQQLKDSASEALKQWRTENPEQALDDQPFWMVGEVFDQPLYKNYYYDYGFDSLINFEFQDKAHELAMCMSSLEPIYQDYAERINSDADFNGLTYISSHDTTLFYSKYDNLMLQQRIAAPFLLLPGGVQIYYGDESGRPLGPYGDDFHQGTRSDMNWADIKDDRARLVEHWQKIGQFRQRHNAIGAGQHTLLSQQPYTFARTLGEDRAIVVFAGNEAP